MMGNYQGLYTTWRGAVGTSPTPPQSDRQGDLLIPSGPLYGGAAFQVSSAAAVVFNYRNSKLFSIKQMF